MSETNYNRIPNKFLRTAVEFLKRHGYSQSDLYPFFGMTKASLHRAKTGFPSDDARQPILTKDKACKLHVVTGIDLDQLLLSPEEEAEYFDPNNGDYIPPEKRDLYFTRDFYLKIRRLHAKNPILKILKFHPEDKNPTAHYQAAYDKNYTDVIIDYYNRSQHSILVFDPLFRGNKHDPGDNLTCYQNGHKRIFRILEKKIQGIMEHNVNHPHTPRKFSYKRLIAVDPDDSLHPKNKEEELIEAMLIDAPMQLLLHIYASLHKFDRLCELYVTSFARFRHQWKIDNIYLLSEDFIKRDKSYIVEPETVIVERIEEFTDVEWLGSFDRLFDDERTRYRITLENFNLTVFDHLINKLKNRLAAKTANTNYFRNADLPYFKTEEFNSEGDLISIADKQEGLQRLLDLEDARIDVLRKQFAQLEKKRDKLYKLKF